VNGYVNDGRRSWLGFPSFNQGEPLLITAMNQVSHFNGFYQKRLDEKGDPELLSMGPYTFYHAKSQLPGWGEDFDDGQRPIKASEANVWIVYRQSAIDAPNYFVTKDLKTYTALSNFQPQKKYNWLTTE